MDKLKNVIIVNDFDYIQGGASKVAIDTANILANSNKNLNVYFFSASHSENSNLDEKINKLCTNQGEALKDKNKIRGFVNGIYNIKAKNELKKVLKTLNKDETIIHIHGWTKALSSSVFEISLKKKFNTVLTMHDYFTVCPNGGLFNYKTSEICDFEPLSWKCINCDCDSRNYFFKMYRLIRQLVQNKNLKHLKYGIAISELVKNKNKKIKNIRIIENPIEEIFQRINVEENKKYIYIGRVCKEKGTELFCKAISDLNLNGVVVGDGGELEYLKTKYENIEFTGWIENIEVKKYLNKAKCLIFPSVWPEPAGLTALEAISRGIPIIVSSNTATESYVKKYDAGLIFENNNVEDLKEKIKLLNSNGKEVYANYQKNPYSIKKYCDELLEFYNYIGENK